MKKKNKFTHIECPRSVREVRKIMCSVCVCVCNACAGDGTGAREALRCAFEENCIFSILKETRWGGKESIHENEGAEARRATKS